MLNTGAALHAKKMQVTSNLKNSILNVLRSYHGQQFLNTVEVSSAMVLESKRLSQAIKSILDQVLTLLDGLSQTTSFTDYYQAVEQTIQYIAAIPTNGWSWIFGTQHYWVRHDLLQALQITDPRFIPGFQASRMVISPQPLSQARSYHFRHNVYHVPDNAVEAIGLIEALISNEEALVMQNRELQQSLQQNRKTVQSLHVRMSTLEGELHALKATNQALTQQLQQLMAVLSQLERCPGEDNGLLLQSDETPAFKVASAIMRS